MADTIDMAADQAEQQLAGQIAAVRQAARDARSVDGVCRNCGELVSHGGVFCDADCRDDYERVARARRINGWGNT
ncbi:hypothetical protein GO283_04559 [Ralstonia solanacearum]|uniref:hypothetical protein n=1 Tax=Ralstonia pseudosolanacearum TaxID=1310165 RepID=UPI0007C9529D|nr:hypothetical protein [Ralstonia pseudosolanacearum]NKA32800.1 hypothetical protein [Ralstonia solanacearum]NKA74381.1 hypothetical protein [Ralstonia solanacearum]NKA95993.1 hypothetical protein [Ralstonia solanacearum]NKF87884.1 hypothetical protein [Ralstonia solanacearum]NKF96404.1 hypothetical protein [Ralstonia solanacearum]